MSELPSQPTTEPVLVSVGDFAKLAAAREAALVLAARGWAHQIDRAKDRWVLSVDAAAEREARQELQLFQAEKAEGSEAPVPRPEARTGAWSALFAGCLLAGAFLFQLRLGQVALDFGAADAAGILQRHEWWRTFTALLLHADLSHLLANVAFGILFAVFLIPHVGNGVGWLLIVLSGGLGNAANAWGYRQEAHRSIGASTAVFAALGLLIGGELWHRWRSPVTRTRRHLLPPLGAGFALLALMGVGEENGQVDFMAHGWGFLVGLALGAAYEALSRGHLAPPLVQKICGAGALLVLSAACALAWKAAVAAGAV